jgi:hypothetical protein
MTDVAYALTPTCDMRTKSRILTPAKLPPIGGENTPQYEFFEGSKVANGDDGGSNREIDFGDRRQKQSNL